MLFKHWDTVDTGIYWNLTYETTSPNVIREILTVHIWVIIVTFPSSFQRSNSPQSNIVRCHINSDIGIANRGTTASLTQASSGKTLYQSPAAGVSAENKSPNIFQRFSAHQKCVQTKSMLPMTRASGGAWKSNAWRENKSNNNIHRHKTKRSL